MHRILAGGILSAVAAFGLATTANAEIKIERSGNTYHMAVCDAAAPGFARCHAHVVVNSKGELRSNPHAPIFGYVPSDLRSAYAMQKGGAATTVIAIVDAFGYTNAESDLAV